jgi:hypothetical protein
MYNSRGDGPPAWFITIIGIALVFGAFRVWIGIQDFFSAGGVPLPIASEQAQERASETAVIQATIISTRFPSATPPPACQEYIVRSGAGLINIRAANSTVAPIIETLNEGQTVCVLQQLDEWYLIDRDTRTRRIEEGYIFEGLIVPANPSPTPSQTFTPPPTITLTFTPTPTPTSTFTPTPTRTPRS